MILTSRRQPRRFHSFGLRWLWISGADKVCHSTSAKDSLRGDLLRIRRFQKNSPTGRISRSLLLFVTHELWECKSRCVYVWELFCDFLKLDSISQKNYPSSHRITEPFSALTNKNNNPLCVAGQLGSGFQAGSVIVQKLNVLIIV